MHRALLKNKFLPGVRASSLRWLMVYCREHQVSYSHAKFSKTKMEKVAKSFKKRPSLIRISDRKELTSEERKEKEERKKRRRKMERRGMSCPPDPYPNKRRLIRLINNGGCLPEKLLELKTEIRECKKSKSRKCKRLKNKYHYRNSLCIQLKNTKLPCLI